MEHQHPLSRDPLRSILLSPCLSPPRQLSQYQLTTSATSIAGVAEPGFTEGIFQNTLESFLRNTSDFSVTATGDYCGNGLMFTCRPCHRFHRDDRERNSPATFVALTIKETHDKMTDDDDDDNDTCIFFNP